MKYFYAILDFLFGTEEQYLEQLVKKREDLSRQASLLDRDILAQKQRVRSGKRG